MKTINRFFGSASIGKLLIRERGLRALNVLASLLVLISGGLIIKTPDLGASITVNNAQYVTGTADLLGIACPSASTCYAVGYTRTGPGPQNAGVVVTITNGVPDVPQTIDGVVYFTGIACPTTSICYAVGYADSNSAAIVTITNGIPDAPKYVSTPLPSLIYLNVGCSTASSCYVVGTGGLIVPITNGIPASSQSPPDILEFFDIACPSTSTCLAVGHDDLGQAAMVPITDGVVGPKQVLADFPRIQSIACPSSTCYALGPSTDLLSAESEGFVVPITNGAFGTPRESHHLIWEIGCVSGSGVCIGAGTGESTIPFVPLLFLTGQITNGIAGVPQPFPLGLGLNRLSCPNDTTCVVVGGPGYCSYEQPPEPRPPCPPAGFFELISLDNTPPTLSLPGNIVVNATGPSGASVSYSVSASDPDDTLAPPNCLPPSGAVFPIGTTTVNCSVVDSAGNTASGSFTVTVNGPQQQLSDLLALVTGLAPGSSLAAKIQVALNAVQQGGNLQACSSLQAFINEVKAQSGKMLSTAQATNLIMAANRIQSILGC
jgi:hypothetical protein